MKKILIIDDDPQFADMLNFQLGRLGFEVEIAHTPIQTEEYFDNRNFDLVVLDVFFPNRNDGLDLLRKIKQNIQTDHIPIILVTSQPSELFMQEPNFDEYLQMAKEFVSKIDGPKVIAEKVGEILSSK